MSMIGPELGQVAITVTDVDQALVFYRDVLELPFLFRPSANLAFLAAGSVRLMLTTPQGAGLPGANSILYFRVKDIVKYHATLVGKGVTDGQAPQKVAQLTDHELWIGFVRDFDGNLVGLMEETSLGNRE